MSELVTQTVEQSEDRKQLSNLTVLRVDQALVVDAWDIIKQGFCISLPQLVEANEWTLANLQAALISGRMDAWIVSDIGGSNVRVLGVVTTVFTEDTLARLKYLYVYSMAAFEAVPDGVWRQVLTTLESYAKHKGCNYISAYTAHSGLLALAKDMGAKTDLTLVVKEL